VKHIWSTSKTLWDAANICPSRKAALDAAAKAVPGESVYIGQVRSERPDAREVAEMILPGLLRVICERTIIPGADERIENVSGDTSAFQRRLSDFLIGDFNRPEWDVELSGVCDVKKYTPIMEGEADGDDDDGDDGEGSSAA